MHTEQKQVVHVVKMFSAGIRFFHWQMSWAEGTSKQRMRDGLRQPCTLTDKCLLYYCFSCYGWKTKTRIKKCLWIWLLLQHFVKLMLKINLVVCSKCNLVKTKDSTLKMLQTIIVIFLVYISWQNILKIYCIWLTFPTSPRAVPRGTSSYLFWHVVRETGDKFFTFLQTRISCMMMMMTTITKDFPYFKCTLRASWIFLHENLLRTQKVIMHCFSWCTHH